MLERIGLLEIEYGIACIPQLEIQPIVDARARTICVFGSNLNVNERTLRQIRKR